MIIQFFVDREKEIDEIITRIKNQNQSTAVYGEPGFGKTALLKYLTDPELFKKFGLSKDLFVVVYLKCPDDQSNNLNSPNRFWQKVFIELENRLRSDSLKKLARSLKTQKEFDYFIVENFFWEAKQQNLNIILLLDDFDNLLADVNFNNEFLWSLKNLANNKIDYNFGMVTASLTQLSILCHDNELLTSPFFNIFSNARLAPFTKNQSLEYLAKTFKQLSSKQDIDVEYNLKLVRMSCGIPLMLKLVAQHFQNSATIRENSHQIAWHPDEQQTIKYFTGRCWKNSGVEERRFMLQLAFEFYKHGFHSLNQETVSSLQKKFRAGWESLTQRGLANEKSLVMNLFPEIYSRFIVGEVLENPELLEVLDLTDTKFFDEIRYHGIKIKEQYHILF